MGGCAALQGRAAGVGGDRGLHLPAVHVVEHYGRHPVAIGFKQLFGILVHRFVRVAHSPVELHIGEDIEHRGHFLLAGVAFHRGFEDQIKHRFQVGAPAPGKRADVHQLVPQGFPVDFHQVGIALEGDQVVVEHPLAPFGAVQTHGLGNQGGLERAAATVHGAGNVHHADGVLVADGAGQPVPKLLQGIRAFGLTSAPGTAVKEGPKHFIREQRVAVNALVAAGHVF